MTAPEPDPASSSNPARSSNDDPPNDSIEAGQQGNEVDDAGLDSSSVDAVSGPGHSRLRFVLLLAAIIVVADQITKVIAVATLTPGVSPSILGGLVHFSLIRNPGAAWSMGTNFTWVLAIIASVIVVVIIRMASKLRSTWWATCFGLILGGAIGNLIDRVFRSPGFFRGHVVDFVSIIKPNAEFFPVFNVADSGITIGGILLVITALLGIEFDGTRHRKSDAVKNSG